MSEQILGPGLGRDWNFTDEPMKGGINTSKVPRHVPDLGKMVPLLCRARNALAGQGHMPFGEQGHEPGCSLCSAAELVDQAIHYAADTGKACDTCDREGEDGIHEHCEDYYACRQGGASDYWKPKERSATT